ncbi:MAG: DUF4435 domain-containing protein [Bacteroidetes bacterium]|nr:DUF4435 domain-containing protein [Bacteroidota bacterium]
MSGFRRTIGGLSNQHLFFNVDLIVFVEGGSMQFNKEQVYAGRYSDDTEDIIFWDNIFKKFRPDLKIKFKSIGSKKTISDIVLDLIEGELKTVMVAMDSEFDELLNRKTEYPGIFYTYGYSWENDVWNQDVIKAIIEELTAVKIENQDIENNFNDFLDKIKVAVYADAYLFKDNSSFFNRKKGLMFCVDCDPVDLPLVQSIKIDDKFNEKGITKRKAMRYGNKMGINTLQFCYGHLLADYCCLVVHHYLKKRHSLTNLSNAIIYRMSIKKHFDLRFDGSNLHAYYSDQFKKIGTNPN